MLAGIFGFLAIKSFMEKRFGVDPEKIIWEILEKFGLSGIIAVIFLLFIAYVLYSKAYRG